MHILVDHVLQLYQRHLHLVIHLHQAGHRRYYRVRFPLSAAGTVQQSVTIVSGMTLTGNLHSSALRASDQTIQVESPVLLDAAAARVVDDASFRVKSENERLVRRARVNARAVDDHLDDVEETVDQREGC